MRYALLLLMVAPLGAFADAGTTTLMHRIFAGSFDTSGWTVAESTNGAFSVQMPGPFEDFTQTGGADAVADKTEGIRATAPNGMVFIALKLLYNKKGTARDEFEDFKSGAGLPAAKVTHVGLVGLEALDISYGDSKSSTSERVILDGEALYTLSLQWGGSGEAPEWAAFQPFVASFKQLPPTSPRIERPTIWQNDQVNPAFMHTLTKDACMKKTIATISRSGCATNQCLAFLAGTTGACVAAASGHTEQFCASYDTQYIEKLCAPGGLDESRCSLLSAVKQAICAPKPTP